MKEFKVEHIGEAINKIEKDAFKRGIDARWGGRMDVVENGVEIMHIGKCIKCGKPLTDATSIEIGLGPVCRHT